jgi:hypothetical protein
VHFCATHGIVVPRNFDISQASSRFALIDISSDPSQLLPRTTYQRKHIAAFLKSPEALGRRYRILDFRFGRELEIRADESFAECGKFDPASPGEVLHLVAP